MIDIRAERDKFYDHSRKTLLASGASSFTDLAYKATENLLALGITEEVIDKVLFEFAPYFRYWEYRGKEELLNKVIDNACEE